MNDSNIQIKRRMSYLNENLDKKQPIHIRLKAIKKIGIQIKENNITDDEAIYYLQSLIFQIEYPNIWHFFEYSQTTRINNAIFETLKSILKSKPNLESKMYEFFKILESNSRNGDFHDYINYFQDKLLNPVIPTKSGLSLWKVVGTIGIGWFAIELGKALNKSNTDNENIQ